MPIPDVLIVEAFFDCGMSQQTGMGELPISWQEIKSYSDASGINLTSWEARMVRLMSKEYLSFKSESEKYQTLSAPYEPELTEEDLYNRGKKADEMWDNLF